MELLAAARGSLGDRPLVPTRADAPVLRLRRLALTGLVLLTSCHRATPHPREAERLRARPEAAREGEPRAVEERVAAISAFGTDPAWIPLSQ